MAVAPDEPIDLPAVTGAGVAQLSAPAGLRLSGQKDMCDVALLRRAIAGLPPEADEIHLQLAGLEYIDVAAARELVLLVTRPSRPQLVLHDPPLVLLRLIEVCWPEAWSRVSIAGLPRVAD